MHFSLILQKKPNQTKTTQQITTIISKKTLVPGVFFTPVLHAVHNWWSWITTYSSQESKHQSEEGKRGPFFVTFFITIFAFIKLISVHSSSSCKQQQETYLQLSIYFVKILWVLPPWRFLKFLPFELKFTLKNKKLIWE